MSDTRNSRRQNGHDAFETTDQEELLKRGLVRVSIAADGVDPLLDRQLKELRSALRSDAPPFKLADLMPDLEHAVLTADSARQSNLQRISLNLRQLAEQLQELDPPKDAAKTLRQLLKRLDKPIEYASKIPDLLDDLVDVQGQALNPNQEMSAPGLWTRLFGRATDQAEEPEQQPAQSNGEIVQVPGNLAGEEHNYSVIAANIEGILLNLLSELQVVDAQVSQAERLREQVTRGLNWYELAAVLDELSLLILSAQNERQADFERYLLQLNKRLAQFQGNLEAAHDAYNNTLEAGRALEGAIRNQVEDLHDDVRDASDLDLLKANVEAKLDALLSNVDQARSLREQHEQDVAERLQVMVERIRVMEVEAQTFRKHLEEQRERAMVDSLTGLPNRAGLQKRMEEEFDRWQRYGGQLLLAVLDVDHFKSINDNFGHLAGDKVLRLIAQQLSRRLRKTDFIGRFGGEEFVLLMPGTSSAQGQVVLEELRSGIEACPFHFKSERVPITISLGYTEFRADDSLDEVFDRADRAMYRAKDDGRNQLICAD